MINEQDNNKYGHRQFPNTDQRTKNIQNNDNKIHHIASVKNNHVGSLSLITFKIENFQTTALIGCGSLFLQRYLKN